ncbi:cyclopropane-fatty-acyl-phospholipid synthase family protein [Bradyrhizobium liaoningense]|uniref:SAM-dependent methyltransferase n=1 Tax=Bradyrhizobium liaoningense TaxID=43992 RepID=UPI001BAE4179|nr:class I SAM-dependent methyltransferase [Bradyrhizobium liaoningense]MBR1031486.1 class I SAM-dependent methyltransferase [Bradyrhizobium liaoningense]
MLAEVAGAEGLNSAANPVDFLRRNQELYDNIDSPVWRLAVYEPVFGGARYINMGGAPLVTELIDMLGIGVNDPILDLGCGTGDLAGRICSLTGCHTTGVEMNARQAERARETAQGLTRGRLEIAHADATRWSSFRQFKAVYSIDTLMLIPDWPAFLHVARRALSDQGTAFLATVILDDGLSESERRAFWEEDGFVALLRKPDAERQFTDAGFARQQWTCKDEWALACLGRIDAALHAEQQAIRHMMGDAAWQNWVEINAVYLECFRSRKLTYAMVMARP